ncbi:hypothetical protein GN277_19140 [Lachnospiraceae bacterium WCA-9-b2]|jgi:hypothetical protein|uniref:Lipoprotein n=1 Tax=Sporofaciens musculi TaxID=2681861 RepID=A0A7X3MJE1_9FIRM|nr:hypothetical protein [Sporofaciens musculi]MXP77414.1 hypothetical protein [Sporofaciens musculi]
MKRILIGLIVASSMVFTGCGDKDEKKDTPDTAKQEASAEATGADVTAGVDQPKEKDENAIDGISTLSTEDGSVKISIARPEGFEDVEFSSEQQVAFQRMGADGTSSTQVNLRLMAEDENSVITTAKQEVEYLMSANTDDQGTVGEIQTLSAGERQWSFFSYTVAGEEGYRLWTSLANGCILSCAVENIGSGLEPLAADNLAQMLSASIQE